MRILPFILILLASTTHAQDKIFELSEVNSANFKKYISAKKLIVIGEMHGTKEVPEFVLSLAKSLKQKDKALTVGLEINDDYQNDINEYLKFGDFEKLKALKCFDYPDGRTSVAMSNLIKGLRNLPEIKIVCFDINSKLDNVNRDSLMAINIVNHSGGGQAIMLMGNLHATLKEGYWKPGFKSALYNASSSLLRNEIISLNTIWGNGTYWNCMQDGCKERAVYGNPEVGTKYSRNNFIVAHEQLDDNGYNGFIFFETVHASKPLRE